MWHELDVILPCFWYAIGIAQFAYLSPTTKLYPNYTKLQSGLPVGMISQTPVTNSLKYNCRRKARDSHTVQTSPPPPQTPHDTRQPHTHTLHIPRELVDIITNILLTLNYFEG